MNSVVLSIQQFPEPGVNRGRESELGQVIGQVQLDRDNLGHRVLLTLDLSLDIIVPGGRPA